MDNRLPAFITKNVDELLFNQTDSTFIFYVPEKYFTTKNAFAVGEIIHVFGILEYDIVDNKTGKSKQGGLKLFKYPTMVLTSPATIEKAKALKLKPKSPPKDYRLFKYNKGDRIIVSVKTPEDIDNVERFYNLFIRGNLPNTIPYDQIQDLVYENMKLSGNSYGITMQLIGIMISEIYRSATNLDIPYRLSGSTDPLAYEAMDVRQIPKHTSPYASLTSENWDDAVVGAVSTKNTKPSPMEKLLMD